MKLKQRTTTSITIGSGCLIHPQIIITILYEGAHMPPMPVSLIGKITTTLVNMWSLDWRKWIQINTSKFNWRRSGINPFVKCQNHYIKLLTYSLLICVLQTCINKSRCEPFTLRMRSITLSRDSIDIVCSCPARSNLNRREKHSLNKYFEPIKPMKPF